MKTSGSGAVCLLGAGLCYLIAEAVTANAWKTPPYSYVWNYISDLGAPMHGMFFGHEIDSPLHAVMNAGFVVQGVLFLVGSLFLAVFLRWAHARAFLPFAVVHAIGVTMVALVPETTPQPVGVLHPLGALLAIVGGNIAIIIGGRTSIRSVMPQWLPRTSVALGVIGIVSIVLANRAASLFPGFLAVVGGGLIERISVYTIIAWELLVGVLAAGVALAQSQRRRREADEREGGQAFARNLSEIPEMEQALLAYWGARHRSLVASLLRGNGQFKREKGVSEMTQRWTENEVPNQTGRVAIVTGANSGIGWETARVLVQKGATVIMACRSMQKATTTVDQLKKRNPAGTVAVMPLDLGDLDNVRAFATSFRANYDRLDLLINNAGVMFLPYGKTAQGFEQQFGINHLGHFALTGLLLDLLNETPDSRVVTVSSGTHRLGIMDFDNLNWKQGYDPQRAYGRSKLANLLFTYELQRRLTAARKSTLAVAAHPGWAATNLTQHSSPTIQVVDRIFGQKPEKGALPTLYAATAPAVQGGEYFGPGGFRGMRGSPKKAESNERSHDEGVARRLWTISEELTQVTYQLERL